ncbi:hypothetical protein PP993_gp57 [Gordonia phage Mayweather]|uniref:Uncharacterized protein n=1 Tax=Gordonia phage Mayweather TaxID=2590931 RepID=A0A516KU57_9CAUD|nr:hypothetical protein PP993_gp57 [Gordonia phage Mayweather]QDP45218.1 hypothetical protein SEA_MAYWEATHER_57 [Gordonia phage Mayweather]
MVHNRRRVVPMAFDFTEGKPSRGPYEQSYDGHGVRSQYDDIDTDLVAQKPAEARRRAALRYGDVCQECGINHRGEC